MIFLTLCCVIPSLSTGCGTHDKTLEKSEAVHKELGNLHAAYQRRMDLVPNLVSTVKAYAAHESEIWEEFAKARQQVEDSQINPQTATTEEIATYMAAQGGLSSSMSRIIGITEAYPDLKSDALFQNLMVQLEGSENRINQARRKYNQRVEEYNSYRGAWINDKTIGGMGWDDKFPEKYDYYQSDEGADKAPTVNFD
jgi:LemA protein